MSSEISHSNMPDWNIAKRISFRFFFIFFVLYILPFPAYYIPGVAVLSGYFSSFMESITLWFGTDIFGITETIDSSSNGSGDRLYSFVSMFTNLIIALLGCVIWSVIDFRRKSYNKLLSYFTVYVRFYLASVLLSYGFSKVFTNQFSELSLNDLIKPYGESSPMALMWNFMEFSDSYTIFSGASEVLGGILLLWRRTTTLGALVTVGVMFNVFMMNMSYDIPVKLYSGHLTLMGMFLLVLDGKRILNFLVFNKAVVAKKITPHFKKKAWRITGIVLKYAFVVYLLYSNVSRSYESQRKWGKKAPKPALYGIYEVEEFVWNSDTLPALKTDSIRWDRLVVDKYSTSIHYMNGQKGYYKNETDTLEQKLYLSSFRDDSSKNFHDFQFTSNDSLFYLNGCKGLDSMRVKFKIKKREDFLLLNRGFHWVNDFPFNR
ncbi:MAG: DoxX family protein [Bacteroidota bacterium]